jgi:GntR family transcriptional repressor for pyruvate dehydrogenase complex
MIRTTDPNTRTLTNGLADRIRNDLLLRDLQEDQLFMTEGELTQRYDVSRNVAREAVNQLRALGILKSRQKKGLLMGRAEPANLLSQSLPFYARSDKDMRYLSQLRYVLEIGAIPLAVMNATDQQISQAHDLIEDCVRLFDSNATSQEQDVLELKFHGMLLQMTGNPLVTDMHQVVVEFFEHAPQHLDCWADVSPLVATEHADIVQAIEQRNITKAQTLMIHHLRMLSDPQLTIDLLKGSDNVNHD